MSALPEAVRELLIRPNLAHVATLMGDGMPHAVPTWVGVEGERIVFLTGPRSQKARNLDGDPRLSLSVTDYEQSARMAHVRGRVVDRLDGDEAWAIIDRLANEYTGTDYPRGLDRIVFVVDAEHAVAHDYS
ncbi:MAG TPA: pyridoxamine 5'-phosphate oxidase family protein [Euzebyales bacterium]|nr:pyridoxamine 5'-phosphate oxidase family protein [Euzebyales bacterium]